MRIVFYFLFFAIGYFIGIILACSIIEKTNPITLTKDIFSLIKEDIE